MGPATPSSADRGGGISGEENFAGKISLLRKVAKFSPWRNCPLANPPPPVCMYMHVYADTCICVYIYATYTRKHICVYLSGTFGLCRCGGFWHFWVFEILVRSAKISFHLGGYVYTF